MRIVWCDEAVVLDRVPADRVTRDWVLRRAFRMSNTGTRVDLLLAPAGPPRLRVRVRDTGRGLARVAGGALRVLQGAVTRRAGDRVRGVRTVYRGVGMVAGAAGFVYAEYDRGAHRRWPVRWQARAVSGLPAGFALVVVNYGAPDLLATHVRPSVPAGARVVVVDNFSEAVHRDAVVALADEHGWTVVLSARNEGFGAGVNRGVARARELGCTRFLLLNPDCRVTPEVATALDAHVREHPLTLTGVRIDAPGRSRPWFVGYALDPRTGVSRRDPDLGAGDGGWGWLTGACLAVHVDLWDRVGGFDADYFLYWEDVDLSRRVVGAGGALTVRSDLEARHDVGGTQSGTGKSPLYCYHNTRNRLLFASRHVSRRRQFGWLLRAPGVAIEIVRRSGTRYAVTHPSLLWAAIRGTAVGATVVVRSWIRPVRNG